MVTNQMIVKAAPKVKILLDKYSDCNYWDDCWNEEKGRLFTAIEKLEYETKKILEAAL